MTEGCKNVWFLCMTIGIAVCVLLVCSLFIGSVHIPLQDVISIVMGDYSDNPAWNFIILESLLPQTLTAMFCGGGLAVSGLILQTVFHNPLADPSVFGISSAAGLGVAVVVLITGGTLVWDSVSSVGLSSVLCSAFAGSILMTAVIFFISVRMRSKNLVIIVGLMAGYLVSSMIILLSYFSSNEGLRSYVTWGMGSFGNVPLSQIPLFAGLVIVGVTVAALLVKPLNVLSLGDRYAMNLGINANYVRNRVLVVSGLLTAVTTAFCGPVAFIGLIVPHFSRLMLGSSDFRKLLPATVLVGAAAAMFCNIATEIVWKSGTLPLNAVTSFLGAPVIIYILMKNTNTEYD